MSAVVSVRRLRGCCILTLEDGTERRLPRPIFRGLHLRPGSAYDPEKVEAYLAEHALSAAYEKCAFLLGMRSRTEAQLSRSLSESGYTPEIVARVLAQLRQAHYVDDTAFCQSWIRRRMDAGIGLSRIRMELRQKGIPAEVLERALLEATDDEERLSDGLMRAARRALRRYDLDDPRQRQNCIASLLRRGFSYAQAKDALCALEEEE